MIRSRTSNLEKSLSIKPDNGNGFDNGNGYGNGKVKDIISLYTSDLGKYPLLTREQEIGLVKRREKGTKYEKREYGEKYGKKIVSRTDDAKGAIQELVVHNLGLVIFMIKRNRNFKIPLSDLIQEGNMALMRAANNFDYKKGFKFSTYATRCIYRGLVRVTEEEGKYKKVRLDIEKSYEIAEIMDLSPDLDAYIPSENKKPIMEENRKAIRRLAFSKLSNRERKLISLRFWKKKNLFEIGKDLGLTKERVRQLLVKAIIKMRRIAEKEKTLSVEDVLA